MPSSSNRRTGGSSLMDLQPVDAGAFQSAASGWLVWGSLILVWVASLLPWRLWQPVPDVLLLLLLLLALTFGRLAGLLVALRVPVLIGHRSSPCRPVRPCKSSGARMFRPLRRMMAGMRLIATKNRGHRARIGKSCRNPG